MTLQKVRSSGSDRRKRGSVFIEATFGIGISLLSVVLNIELARKAHVAAIVHHLAFWAARMRALGESRSEWKNEMRTILFPLAGSKEQRRWETVMEKMEENYSSGTSRGLETGVTFRYSALLPFKRTFQVTKRCKFPF